jgi:hypothetical protein
VQAAIARAVATYADRGCNRKPETFQRQTAYSLANERERAGERKSASGGAMMGNPMRIGVLCAVVLLSSVVGKAQNAKFEEALKQHLSAIAVRDGKLAGAGGELLRSAISDAHFVLLGEDHGIQQVPAFASALCGELAPRGFRTLTLEAGPTVTRQLEKFSREPDGAKQFSDFEKQYPFSVAFYNWREEFDLLTSCQRAAGPEGMSIWGIDQELMGSSGFLLDKILATGPGPRAKAAVESLRQENTEDLAEASKTGNPGELLMMKASQEKLDAARDLLNKEGSAEAQHLFAALLVSREIYRKNMAASYYASNRQRTELMKSNFVPLFSAAMQKAGQPPKVFFKFGGWHMYRGLNPLHSSEIGNLVNEFAEAHGLKSVHILILGVKGEQLHFAGIGKPFEASPLDLAKDKDSEFAFMGPFISHMLENQWTIFDLRALRDQFSSYGKLDPEVERLTFGMDFVVLIPDPKAAHGFDGK